MELVDSSTAVSMPLRRATIAESQKAWVVRGAQIFLSLWLVYYLAAGLGAALWFRGDPFDGPFQLFNPLRRIAAGQVAGRDFVFFHGIGVPYLFYPIFALLGGKSLVASELSRQLTSFLLFAASVAAFARVTFRGTAQFWIAAACAVLLLETALPNSAGPGNSLIAARSTMPILVFAALQLPAGLRIKALITGFGISLAFLFGIEHGLSLALALVLVTAMVVVSNAWRARWEPGALLANVEFAAIALATACASSTLLLWSLCGSNGIGRALRYNLSELPADQFWLFGAPPMPILGSWRQLLFDRHAVLCFLPAYIGLVALVWVIARFWSRPLRLDRDWPALAALMLVYGLLTTVPMLGFLSRHYAFPMVRILVLVGLVVWQNRAWPGFLSRLIDPVRQHPAFVSSALMSVFLVAAGILAFRSTVSASLLVQHLRAPFLYSRFLDHRWDSFMAQSTRLIDTHRNGSNVSLWSAYSALLEAHYGVFAPSSDYLIHSVGPQRWRDYVSEFSKDKPQLVTTLTTDFDFEEWLQNERWDFYEALLNNYSLLARVEHALIWQKTANPWRPASLAFQPLRYDPLSSSVELPPAKGVARIAVVQVHYHIRNGWQWIPLLGKTPRFLATLEGTPRNLPVSFPPYASVFRFPVELNPSGAVTLRFTTLSLLPNTAFQPDEVEFSIFDRQPSERVLYGRPTHARQ